MKKHSIKAFIAATAIMLIAGCDKGPKGSPGGGLLNGQKEGSAPNARGINQESAPRGVPNESRMNPNQTPRDQNTNAAGAKR